jgi:hypothetical protein
LRLCTPALAVESFLTALRKASGAVFPAWRDLLAAEIDDCALPYETRRAVFDMHPLDDFFFAGAVGLETAPIRRLFTPEEAGDLLSEIAERADRAAGRSDRLVSAIVFDALSRLDLLDPASHKLPHDEVVHLLLARMGIAAAAPTRHLMDDLLFRHRLGEPLARGLPCWWRTFQGKFVLAKGAEVVPVPAPSNAARRRRARQLV